MNSSETAGLVFGQSVKRVEDFDLLTGRARFVDDLKLPGMLEAAVLRSPHGHAAIRGIDKTAALAMPGVHAVLTLEDFRPHLANDRLIVALPSPAWKIDANRPFLAGKETVHVGEPIALVIADSRYIAEDALALIEVDFDPLPAISDCKAALEPGAPKTHLANPNNLVAEFEVAYGDAAAVFASAPHSFKLSLWQHRGGGHSIECRGAVASWNEMEQNLTLWSSTQTPHAGMRMLVDILGLDDGQVRVITPDVGGGFGPKLCFYQEEAAVAAASRMLGRPIKWIEDRREHFTSTTQERDQYWEVELATDGEGHVLGLRGNMIHDHGAWTARGINVAYEASQAVTMPYDIAAYSMKVRVALTNKVPVSPVRGAGQPQGVFVMERLLDKAARTLGIDRAEIRRRNLIPASKMPFTKPMKTRGGIQVLLDSGDYPKCQQAALDKAGWDGFRARQQAALAEGRYIGIGMANFVKGTGRGPFEGATVRIGTSGKIQVHTGAAAMGQSTKTMMAQVVAEQLGADMENITVTAGDTATIGFGMGGYNSRQAVLAGSAAHLASLVVRKKLLAVASEVLEAAVDDLEIVGSDVRVKGVPDMKMGLRDIAKALAGTPGFRLPAGQSPALEATEQPVIDGMAYANGTAVAEVEIDIETGLVEIHHLTLAHDCGRIINPMIVDGQMVGGAAHGVGNALFEWMGYDENAQPITTNYGEYLLISAPEMPPIDLIHQESPTPLNPLGVKGVGECGVVPTAPAIISAIEDALSPFGLSMTRVPITPAEIAAMIEEAQAK